MMIPSFLLVLLFSSMFVTSTEVPKLQQFRRSEQVPFDCGSCGGSTGCCGKHGTCFQRACQCHSGISGLACDVFLPYAKLGEACKKRMSFEVGKICSPKTQKCVSGICQCRNGKDPPCSIPDQAYGKTATNRYIFSKMHLKQSQKKSMSFLENIFKILALFFATFCLFCICKYCRKFCTYKPKKQGYLKLNNDNQNLSHRKDEEDQIDQSLFCIEVTEQN